MLTFVYNADSGIINGAIDYAHKIISPQTYQCNLCAITYNNFGMNRAWKNFLKKLDRPIEFLHRDELIKRYPDLANTPLPCLIRLNDTQQSEILISAEEMNNFRNLNELIDRVREVAGR